MPKIHLYDNIISPMITEKSTNLSELNKVVFKINKKANKISIKKNHNRLFHGFHGSCLGTALLI